MSPTNVPPEPVPADLSGPYPWLDAYSRTVVEVVAAAQPAVLSLRVGDGRDGRAGSAVLVTPDGYALTNSHVVSGARDLRVRTSLGDALDARVVGDDPSTDLAVIQLRPRDDVPVPRAYVAITESDVMVPGQLVIAIGSPMGFEATISTGVVSSSARSLRARNGRIVDGVIQHSAPLNPGNSGGPLLDARGALLGINTAIIARSVGLGFAVGAATVRWVFAQLMQGGRVERARLGVSARTITFERRLARSLELPASAAEIIDVERDSAAARAGLRSGDRIIAIDATPIADAPALERALRGRAPDADLAVSLVRGARRVVLPIRLGPVAASRPVARASSPAS